MTDALIEGPAPARPLATRGWHALDTAREQRFTGALVLDVGEMVQLFFDRGELYLAERTSDPELADRLLALEVVTADELDAGVVRVGVVRHLGRLFERVPTVDRDAVLAAVELMNAEVASAVAPIEVRGAEAMPYQHHPAGVLRWFSNAEEEEPVEIDPVEIEPAGVAPIEQVPAPPAPESAPESAPAAIDASPGSALAPPAGAALPPPMAGPVPQAFAPPDPPIAEPPPDGAVRPTVDEAAPTFAPELVPRERLDASDAVIAWDQPAWLDGTARADDAPDVFDGSGAVERTSGSDLGISPDWTSSLGIELPRRTPKSRGADPSRPTDVDTAAPEPPPSEAIGRPDLDTAVEAADDDRGASSAQPEPDTELAPAIEVVWPSGDVEARTPHVANAERTATPATPATGATARLAAGRAPAPTPDTPTDDGDDLATIIEIDWSVGTRVVPAAQPAGGAVVDDVVSAVRETIAACEERVAEARPGRPGSVESLASLGGVVQPAVAGSVFDDSLAPGLASAGAAPQLSPEDRSGALRRLIGSLRRP